MIAWFPLIGALAGLISACLGVGGGWLVTPVLLFLGQPPERVVGTSLAFMAITTWRGVREHAHRKSFATVPGRSILALVGGTLVGTEFGRAVLRGLERVGWAAVLLRATLLVVLFGMGWQWRRGSGSASTVSDDGPPRTLAASSAPVLSLLGALGGWVAGMAGLGGGTVVVPLLVHVAHFRPVVAVPISLIAVGVGALWGTVRYAGHGHVDWAAALTLGVGAWLASGLGAQAVVRLPRAVFGKWFGALLWLTAGGVGLSSIGWNRVALMVILIGATALAGAIVVRATRQD